MKIDPKKIEIEKIGTTWLDITYRLHYNGKVYKPLRESGRLLFKIGKYAVKFDPYNKSSVKREFDLYKKLDDRDRKFFPKVYAYDGRKKILILDFIHMEPGRKKRTNINREIIGIISEKYEIDDIEVDGTNNWGICKKTGRPMIYDWEM